MTTGFDTALKVCNYAASLPRYDIDHIDRHHCDYDDDDDDDDDDGEQVQGGRQLVVCRPRPDEHRC